jgi:hypothetical protein
MRALCCCRNGHPEFLSESVRQEAGWREIVVPSLAGRNWDIHTHAHTHTHTHTHTHDITTKERTRWEWLYFNWEFLPPYSFKTTIYDNPGTLSFSPCGFSTLCWIEHKRSPDNSEWMNEWKKHGLHLFCLIFTFRLQTFGDFFPTICPTDHLSVYSLSFSCINESMCKCEELYMCKCEGGGQESQHLINCNPSGNGPALT